MKKMFTLTAVSAALAFMLSTTAFGSCPLKAMSMQPSCSMNTPKISQLGGHYYMPAAPVMQRSVTTTPCCKKKKGFFRKIWTPVQGVYDATFGQILTGLY